MTRRQATQREVAPGVPADGAEFHRRKKGAAAGQANQDAIVPLMVTIDIARAVIGDSRAGIYNKIRAGKLAVKKSGKRTLITYASLVAFYESLPDGLGSNPIGNVRGSDHAA